jgi:hypothetical protein
MSTQYNKMYRSKHTNNTQYMQVFTLNPHLIDLIVTTFLTLFLKAYNSQGKEASKSAGNWFSL